MNLGELVPLEVHDMLRNAKIAKKYFPMLEWDMPYIVEKLREELSSKIKNMPIGYLVREIRPRKVLGLKVGNSWECPVLKIIMDFSRHTQTQGMQRKKYFYSLDGPLR